MAVHVAFGAQDYGPHRGRGVSDAAAVRPAKRALGKTTEFASTSAERFDLKRHLYALQRLTWKLLPQRRRLQVCHNLASPSRFAGNDHGISLRERCDEHGFRVSIHGLMQCASVWTCPVCAPRVAQGRVDELRKAMAKHHEAGGTMMFVTLTYRHTRSDQLAELVERMSDARRRFKSGRWIQAVREAFGVVGQVGALEVTHGEANGWHPHYHEIWFCGPDADPQQLKDRLFPKWRTVCERVGLGSPSMEYGVDVRCVGAGDEQALSQYPVFGSDLERSAREMVLAHTKRGRRSDSRTPWQLLIDAYEGDKRAASLWVDFTRAFRGRAALYWSKGLKAHFGVDDRSDEELAESVSASEAEESTEVHRFRRDEWALICKWRARDAVVQVAYALGAQGVVAFIESLRQRQRQRWRSVGIGTHVGLSGAIAA